MTRITNGEVFLYTFKEGILSAIAHDLRLRLKRFRLEFDGAEVVGKFIASSLVVDGVMLGEKLDDTVLSDRDKSKIRAAVLGEVLRTSEFDKVVFRGRVSQEGAILVAKGELEMVGTKQPLRVQARLREGRYVGEIELTPSLWGVRPYRALGGTLKVQDRVRVCFDLPAEG